MKLTGNKMAPHRWLSAFYGFALCATLWGCAGISPSIHINISNGRLASVSGEGGHTVSVSISSADLQRIADEEIYASIVVISCKELTQRYPTETYIGAVKLDNFDAVKSISQKYARRSVKLSGVVIDSFISRTADPCVKLEGGSYNGKSVTSNTLSVVKSVSGSRHI
jgi:hypothetical protein